MTDQMATLAESADAGPQQFIRIYDDAQERRQRLQISWPSTHGWPPPERLAYVVGLSGTGNEALITEDGYEEIAAQEQRRGHKVEEVYSVVWYTRARCSMLDDETVAPGNFVARGATYIPEVGRLEVRCNGCGKSPNELDEFQPNTTGSELSAEEYVQAEEGTYNAANGHFLCTPCYIDAGQPTMPGGRGRWVAP